MFATTDYHYQLNDFMAYPNLALKMAFFKPFRRPNEPRQSLLAWVFFSIGTVNMVYQNLGIVIAFIVNESKSIDIVRQIAETGAILGLTVLALCKLTLLFWYRRDIARLMDEFEALFPGKHRVHVCCRHSRYKVHRFAEFSRRMMKLTSIFFVFAFAAYNFIPIGHSFFELVVLGQPFKRRFQSNTWYPWDGDSHVAYVLSYGCQFCSSFTGAAFILAGEFMLCFFLTQIRMHFDFLATALESLDAVLSEANPDCLRWLIDYHSTLIRLSTQINHIFNISFLVNFATSSVAMCLMGCSMVMGISLVGTMRYSIGLMTFLVFTLFICYNGNEFTQTSAMLHSAAFYHNWYDATPRYRKTILIVMMRAAKPSVLQAYKFSTVSMGTFMSILKFSYQLFTFFRAMDG